jgi:DNA-binding beta-propeller fold protein YncE
MTMTLIRFVLCASVFLAVMAWSHTSAQSSMNKGLLLVANQGDHSLSIIDPDTGTLVGKVTSNGIRGHEVTASPDGKLAYLPMYGDSGVGQPGTDGHTIEVIDIAQKKVVATIDVGRPTRPHWVQFGPDGLLYVSAEIDKSLDVFDPKTEKRIASIPTGAAESHMVAMTKDGKRAYTSNVGVGTVSVLDIPGRKTVTIIPVSDVAQRIALSVDDKYVFTADQKQPRLAVIDTAQNKVTQWIALPAIAYGTGPTLDGKSLIVTLPTTNQVAVVDLATMKVVRTIDVAAHPQEVLLRPGAPVAYVSCSVAGKVSAIDLKEWRVVKTLNSGPGADGLGWAAQ